MLSPDDNRVTFFARTLYRNIRDLFGIKRSDRLFHTYIIGKTGAGKSCLLLTLILQDIHNGEGITVIDPHGDLVEAVAADMKNGVLKVALPKTAEAKSKTRKVAVKKG